MPDPTPSDILMGNVAAEAFPEGSADFPEVKPIPPPEKTPGQAAEAGTPPVATIGGEDPPAPAVPPEPATPAPPPVEDTVPDDLTPPNDVLPEDLRAPPPPAEPPPAIEEPDLTKMPEKAASAFQRMRQENKELSDKVTALESGQSDNQRVTTLQAELKTANDTIGELSLAAHPGFKAKYDLPMQHIVDRSKSMLKEMEMDESVADEAVKMGLKARHTFLHEKVPDLAASLFTTMTEYDRLGQEREAALADHVPATGKLNMDLQTSLTNGIEDMFTKTLPVIREEGHFLFRPVEGNEGWNKTVGLMTEKARALVMSQDPGEQIKAMMLGAEAPVIMGLYNNERAKSLALQAELNKLRGIQPGVGASPAPAATKPGEPGSFVPLSVEDLAAEMKLRSQ